MRENSITLAAVSPKDNVLAFLATLARLRLRERLSDDQDLEIRGLWTIMKRGEATIQKRTKINVCLPIHDRNAVWKAKVKSIFNFVSVPSIFSQSMSSQDNESMAIDRHLAHFAVDDRRYWMVPQYNESYTSFSMSCSQILQKPITPIARMQSDDGDINFPAKDRTKPPATKSCDENISDIERSTSEFDRLADLTNVQHPTDITLRDSIVNSRRDNLNDHHSEGINDHHSEGINDHHSEGGINDHHSEGISDHHCDCNNDHHSDGINDHLSDHSSGISLDNDMSVVDYDEFENGMDENLGFRASSQRSFSSTDSYFSDIDEQVKRFIEETEKTPPASQEILEPQPTNQHTDGNVSLAEITYSMRNIIRSISPASCDEHFEDKTDSLPVPLEHSSSETRNSFQRLPIPSTSFRETFSPIRTADNELANETMRTSTSKLNFSKVYTSNEMSRSEKIEDKIVVPMQFPEAHELFADDTNMGDYDNDQDDKLLDASVDLKSRKAEAELTIDDEGMIFDDRGCVFANYDVVEDALYVYIENNGLEYLKSETFKAASPERRRRSDREFWAIQRMINGKFEGDTFSPNESIVCTSRGKAKRKSGKSSGGSICSNRTDISSESEEQHPLKKHKSSESLSDNGRNASVSNVIADKKVQDDNGKSKAAPCTLIELTVVVNYLKDFLETREICGFHRLQLLQSFAKIQEIIGLASNGKDIFSETLANIRAICRQAREYFYGSSRN